MKVQCPISLGELLDKISILKIKQRKISDSTKLSDVAKELSRLESTLDELGLAQTESFLNQLEQINEKLWVIEDDLRDKEAKAEFDQAFIELARKVYFTNDNRFKIKSEINRHYGSDIVEVKSYKDYTAGSTN